jgi:cytochrome c oxidase assembly protein subunit 15
MGWLMVASGLVDQPAVSHFRLTMHLLLALSLIALVVWTLAAMQQPQSYRIHWNGAARGVVVALVILALQIIYGGMTAGLKAGYLSDTWPLMFGVLVPAGLFSFVQPAWLNLLEAPVTVLFVHRWLPFVGLALLPLLWRAVRQHVGYGPYTSRLLWGLVGLVLLQITLGILVLVTHVSLPVALIHQVGAVALLVVLVRMLHHTLTAGSTLSTPVENSVDYVPLHSSI